MIVTKYEAYFNKLAKNVIFSFVTKYERVFCFLRGLIILIRMDT